jgi:hypothetical protein
MEHVQGSEMADHWERSPKSYGTPKYSSQRYISDRMMLAQQTALSGDQLEKRLSTELSNVVLIDDRNGRIHCAGGPEILSGLRQISARIRHEQRSSQ